MHLYYLFSESPEWTGLDEALLAFVSEERQKRILAYRFPKEKKQSLYAALLLPYACTEQYGIPFEETDPLWPEKGKPVLQSHPEISFSLSHSGDCAAAAVSDEEVGMDTEVIRNAPMKTLKRVFTEQEEGRIRQAENPDLEFFRLWTRKEAYGKYLSTGLSSEVLRSDLLLPQHDARITEGILTRNRSFSRDEFLTGLNLSGADRSAADSSALYFSVYGKKTSLKPVCVSLASLAAYLMHHP